MQVGGVDDPGDERPDLLGVPAPVARPRRSAPRSGRRSAPRRSRPGTRTRASGRPAGRATAWTGIRARKPPGVPRAPALLDQEQRRRHPAERERAGRDDRGDDVDDQPGRLTAPRCSGATGVVEREHGEHQDAEHEAGDHRAEPGQGVAAAAAPGRARRPRRCRSARTRTCCPTAPGWGPRPARGPRRPTKWMTAAERGEQQRRTGRTSPARSDAAVDVGVGGGRESAQRRPAHRHPPATFACAGRRSAAHSTRCARKARK